MIISVGIPKAMARAKSALHNQEVKFVKLELLEIIEYRFTLTQLRQGAIGHLLY